MTRIWWLLALNHCSHVWDWLFSQGVDWLEIQNMRYRMFWIGGDEYDQRFGRIGTSSKWNTLCFCVVWSPLEPTGNEDALKRQNSKVWSLILMIGNIIFCCLLFFSSLQNSWIAASSFLVLRQRRISKHFFTARWNSHALDAQISGFRIHRAFYLAFWPCLNTYPVSKETETQALHTLRDQLIVVMSIWWVDTACDKGKRHWNRTFMHLRM